MKTFNHIGILFKSVEKGQTTLAEAFGVTYWTQVFEDPVNDVVVQFGLDPSGICYEIVVPLSQSSPVTHSLYDGVNIVNHTAYLVDDLAAERQRLLRAGFVATSKPKPAVAYGGKPIQFFISHDRLLFELIEAPGHKFDFQAVPEAPL